MSEDTLNQKGVWRKTKQQPKPVGVELLIKRNGEVLKESHYGNPYFSTYGGLQLNTVYSYDNNEEWFDDGSFQPFIFDEEHEKSLYVKLKNKYESLTNKLNQLK